MEEEMKIYFKTISWYIFLLRHCFPFHLPPYDSTPLNYDNPSPVLCLLSFLDASNVSTVLWGFMFDWDYVRVTWINIFNPHLKPHLTTNVV